MIEEMTVELKVHPSFFKEFATKTWVSPNDIVKEMIENAFDEDATKVLITIVNDGAIVIEDDAGMDEDGMEKFLVLGSPHKKNDFISPRLKRTRTGRYGTGRLSFLTSFDSMKMFARQMSRATTQTRATANAMDVTRTPLRAPPALASG
jgi:hypothetical protein